MTLLSNLKTRLDIFPALWPSYNIWALSMFLCKKIQKWGSNPIFFNSHPQTLKIIEKVVEILILNVRNLTKGLWNVFCFLWLHVCSIFNALSALKVRHSHRYLACNIILRLVSRLTFVTSKTNFIFNRLARKSEWLWIMYVSFSIS